jgi:hypothetical protein
VPPSSQNPLQSCAGSSSHPYFDVAQRGLADQSNGPISTDHAGNATLTTLPEGYALVEGGVFCGKTATAVVYLNDENLTPLLEASGESTHA